MNTKICLVLAIIAFAHVSKVNGASRFNLAGSLKSVRNSWAGKDKIMEEPVVEVVEMDNIEKGTQLAKQVDAAVEQARKEGTTGRFFKKFMTMGQNNQPTIIVVPIVMENSVTSPTTTTTTQTITGTLTPTTAAYRLRSADNTDEDAEDEEEIVTEEHEIESDDEEVEEGKATKRRYNKTGNQMRRKNKKQSMKKAFNKGVNVDIPPQYRKYFNNQKQVHIPASMLQNAKAQRVKKNGNKRRVVKRKSNRRN